MSQQPKPVPLDPEHDLEPAGTQGLRNLWYRWLFHHEARDERNFDLVLILLILASVVVVLLDSVPGIKLRWHDTL